MRLLILAALLLPLAACESDDTSAEAAEVAPVGEAAVAEPMSTVTVSYKGRLEDGTVFDQSERSTFNLQEVIPGFREGISGMRVGESKALMVPPEDGYGADPPPGIPPNVTLYFDVELLDVQ